jgi:F420-0:gamma-glutamyl ligase-like protein
MKKENIARLRTYPIPEGSRHKQVSLDQAGFLQSLRPFSEGGIDTTNLPYSLASLPLQSPSPLADEIRKSIAAQLGRQVTVVIVDSDKTYSCCGIHLASRATDIKGIVDIGLFAYLIGRAFKWKARSTPIAWIGSAVSPGHALRVAGLANKMRGHGAGRTTWDMAARFGVALTEVNWEMLEQVEHKPIVILRPVHRNQCRRFA